VGFFIFLLINKRNNIKASYYDDKNTDKVNKAVKTIHTFELVECFSKLLKKSEYSPRRNKIIHIIFAAFHPLKIKTVNAAKLIK
jgi:hypothetical protein